jgi:hypothetical protein
MPLDSVNIVPENNLRLPDALTIKHGPARLLSRFVVSADKAARRKGIEVRLRHDFDELMFLNRHQTAVGNWYPLVDMVNPERTELTPENAFWVSGENENGEIVATWGARIFDWTGTSLAEQARTMWYGRDLGQPCVVTAEAAARLGGFAVCGAASWVRPDYRGLHLSRLVPRLGKAYACARWPLDWSFCYVTRTQVEKGLAASYGQQHLSYSIEYSGSKLGELVLAYSTIDEVYEDFARFMLTELSETADGASHSVSVETSLEHKLTNTSSDGVFQGSISLS